LLGAQTHLWQPCKWAKLGNLPKSNAGLEIRGELDKKVLSLFRQDLSTFVLLTETYNLHTVNLYSPKALGFRTAREV
jgi:hypothetical protein